ncbi:hypothetical protein CYFUS_008832 [Cystobacter fuscus]|uniref:Uncharacterized protein n=1 Tax=Cystobacter fuscus TaxID=43 RepID=A0A250JIQ5_9BACT|nr:hypothetical protein [Cystobacter fuscus]ATB43352.1 hypothetical protein CYFUS_008832 [Cystobacter fuscus]
MTALQLPAFLHGPITAIENAAKAEGRRCAKQYQVDGTFPAPMEMKAVAPNDLVFTHNVADIHDEHPAWRLYMASEVVMSLCDATSDRHLGDIYEEAFRQTAWGALHFALSGNAPESAARTARRLQAVLGFWDSLQHGRYIHQRLNTFLTLEELLTSACGWATDAWCPEGASSTHSRIEVASERMARATKEDCVEAILRQLPHIFSFADGRKLTHPEVVTNPTAWREHLIAMDDATFERLSGVRPAEVLRSLYQWDRQLGAH